MPAHAQHAPQARATWDPAALDTLLRIGREDQAGREQLARAAATQDTAVIFATLRADSVRTRWVRGAVAARGWPARSRVGAEAQGAAWYVVQHSPDSAWRAAMVPTLERLAEAGELPRGDVAALADRVAVHRGQPQRYGTQFDVVEGRLVVAPVADLAGLDARRAAVGLMPMAEYVRLLAARLGLPADWPPRP